MLVELEDHYIKPQALETSVEFIQVINRNIIKW